MKRFLSWYSALLMALLLAACGGEDGGAPSQSAKGGGTGEFIKSLALTPAQGSVPIALGQQFIALATMSDGSVRDITNDAVLHWSTSNGAVATISATGLAIGVAPGSVTITASGTAMGAHFSATAELTVTSPVVTALQITPARAALPIGFEQAFVATAILSDGSSLDITDSALLSWSSSDPAIASIDNDTNKGVATAQAAGSVTITASGRSKGTNFSATARLIVTDAVVTALQLTPATSSLPIGFEQAFVATAILSDGSSLDITNSTVLNWSSSDPAIASIDNGANKGLATAKAVGTVTITAAGTAQGANFSATAALAVTNAVVTALQVTPATASVPIGFEQRFIATAILSDGSSLDITNNAALNWSTSDPVIASIDSGSNKGLAIGKAAGTVTITASGTANGTQFSSTAQLTVAGTTVTSLQISPATASVPVGFEQAFVATAILSDGSSLDITDNAALSWSSSDPTIATIGSHSGLATGITTGNVTVTASGTTNGTHFSAAAELTVTSVVVTSLQVTPITASVPVGFEQAFIATAILSDGSSLDITNNAALSWTSSDPSIATIITGKATGKAGGTATITASGTANNIHFSATAALTVTSAVVTGFQITPVAASVPAGLQQQFVATATLSDGSSLDITNNTALSWSSNSPTIVTINSRGGLATGITLGNATITATGIVNGIHISATAALTVTNAVAIALQVTPATESIPVGFDQAFVATAILSDGSSLGVTSNALLNWSSSDPAIAAITSGIAIGRGEGVATITAYGSINGTNLSATAELTVRAPSGCDMGSLTNLGLIFICPLTKSEADANGISYGSIWSERGSVFVLMTWDQADAYCNNLGNGYRLPTRQEFRDLYFRYGPLHNYAGWPFNLWYWTSFGQAPTYSAMNITNGDTDERDSTSVLYVSCVRSNN